MSQLEALHGLLSSAWWPLVGVYINLHLLQKDTFLIRVEKCMVYKHKEKDLSVSIWKNNNIRFFPRANAITTFRFLAYLVLLDMISP